MAPKEKALEVFMFFAPDLINEIGMSNYTHEINKKFADFVINEMILEASFEVPNIRQKYWYEVQKEMRKL